MIDLTPLDVRSKRGDFKKLMRGYDPQEVDGFLEIVAERLEALIRENMALKERAGALQSQVSSQTDREQAVQAALVTAQELRADIRTQAQREAENIVKASETEGRRLIAEAEAEVRTKLRASERRADKLADDIQELERRRTRFLRDFRQLLERELDVVNVETDRTPQEERTIDLELGARRAGEAAGVTAGAAAARETPLAPDVPTIPPDAGPDEVPPADVPVDQLAAAYEQAEGQTEVPLDQAAGDAQAPRQPSTGRRHDNLLLYLETDEAEGKG
ncbi:MAG TPA: DivIVA domain-containing protein [Longimicrobiales bacterium]|nr:DivIVA domain-containing protein [Longimicrobiales bacterium]